MASKSFFYLLRIMMFIAFVTFDRLPSSAATIRVDPLNRFKIYRQGYNITNKHYWTSTFFTGIYGYSVAILWLLLGIAYGVVRSCNLSCITSSRIVTCKRHSYFKAILFALLFTTLSVVSACVALGSNVKFHSGERRIIDEVIATAGNASASLNDVAAAMKGVRNALDLSNSTLSVSTLSEIDRASDYLSSTIQKLEDESHRIRHQTVRYKRIIDRGLQIAYITTMITISLSLATSIVLLVCGTLLLRVAVKWLIAFCWIISAACWFLFGVYFFLYEVSKDSCTAMESFQKNPYKSSLSSIVPCQALLEAQPILHEASEGIYNIVNEVNANLSDTYPDVVFSVCNPFLGPPEYRYRPNSCSMNSIKIGDIPTVLKDLQCSDSSACGRVRLSISQMSIVEAYASSIQILLDAYPRIESLVDCQFVRDAFAEIVGYRCKPLQRYASIVWASLAILSLALMSVVLVWSIQSWKSRGRCYSAGSVTPHHSKVIVHPTL